MTTFSVGSEWSTDLRSFIVKGIDGKGNGSLSLTTVPTYQGRNFAPTQIFVGLMVGSGIVTFPVFSIGVTPPNYTDLVTSKALTGAVAGNMGNVALNAQYPWLPSGTQVFIKSITPGIAPGPITLAILFKGDWV